MYDRIKHVTGRVELSSIQDNGTLFVFNGTGTIVLPPCDRAGGCQFHVLPRGKSKVTFRVADKSKSIDAGHELTDAYAVKGQQVFDALFAGTWLLTVGSGTVDLVPDDDDPQSNENEETCSSDESESAETENETEGALN